MIHRALGQGLYNVKYVTVCCKSLALDGRFGLVPSFWLLIVADYQLDGVCEITRFSVSLRCWAINHMRDLQAQWQSGSFSTWCSNTRVIKGLCRRNPAGAGSL